MVSKFPQAQTELDEFMEDEKDSNAETRQRREIKVKNLLLKKYQSEIDNKKHLTQVTELDESILKNSGKNADILLPSKTTSHTNTSKLQE